MALRKKQMMYRQQQHTPQSKHDAIEDLIEADSNSDREEAKESIAETKQALRNQDRNEAKPIEENAQEMHQTARSEKPPATPALES